MTTLPPRQTALTDREWQVLGHLCCGKTNEQIGQALVETSPDHRPIEEQRVKSILGGIYKKLIGIGAIRRCGNMKTVTCVWLWTLSEAGYRPKHSAYVVILPRDKTMRAESV